MHRGHPAGGFAVAAGVTGLMQIMPATARAVLRIIKIRYSRTRLKNHPAYNMRLGQAYVSMLLEQYKGIYVLVIAA
jgi:soluble lytic murein transglycosylase-like protein